MGCVLFKFKWVRLGLGKTGGNQRQPINMSPTKIKHSKETIGSKLNFLRGSNTTETPPGFSSYRDLSLRVVYERFFNLNHSQGKEVFLGRLRSLTPPLFS